MSRFALTMALALAAMGATPPALARDTSPPRPKDPRTEFTPEERAELATLGGKAKKARLRELHKKYGGGNG